MQQSSRQSSQTMSCRASNQLHHIATRWTSTLCRSNEKYYHCRKTEADRIISMTSARPTFRPLHPPWTTSQPWHLERLPNQSQKMESIWAKRLYLKTKALIYRLSPLLQLWVITQPHKMTWWKSCKKLMRLVRQVPQRRCKIWRMHRPLCRSMSMVLTC